MGGWRVSGFREVRELGSGAQGRVVLALRQETGAPVAIKYLPPQADEAARARLRHEARMLAQVDSPHVARLHQLVESEYGSAIVMEAVEGVSLKAVLAQYRILEPEAALIVLKGSLLGLAAAHAVGVVHRDYKPANVVVPADGRSKLIDFGIATPAGVTSFGGTPSYMAPEQWRTETVTPATDVYAATCVFYECVTGHRPYQAKDTVALMGQHITAPIPLDHLPEPLRPLVARGMAKQSGHRPVSAADFVAQLEQTAEHAYGPDWEQRGIRRLAAAAVALAALFPLAAAGLTFPGAAGTAGGAGTAAGAGAMGQGAAQVTGGVLAKVGSAKAVLAVAATTAVVTTAGVAAYQVTRPTPRPVTVVLTTFDQAYPDRVLRVQGAQFAQVNGMKDATMRRKANQALRVPLDQAVAYFKKWGESARNRQRCGGRMNVLRTRLQVGLRGPKLVSVRYVPEFQRNCGQPEEFFPGFGVTVDLRTGRALTPDDIYKPSMFTKGGMMRLWEELPDSEEKMKLNMGFTGSGGFFNPLDRKAFFSGPAYSRPTSPPLASSLFTPRGLDLLYAGSDYGAVGIRTHHYTFLMPYGNVRDLLKPELVAVLPKT